jgi:protein SCO1/2
MRRTSALLLAFLLLPSAHCLASAGEPAAAFQQPADPPSGHLTHEGHDHESMQLDSKPEPLVGVEERLGQRIPLAVPFVDEEGREIAIGAAITRPTLLFPVYFSCTAICSVMLANLAQAINEVPLELGKDYSVLAVSFDDEEGAPLALAAKGNFTRILRSGLPPEEWRFLTGEKEAIRSLTDSIGFRFKKTGEHLFIHPNVLVALAPDGTIIRYLYGPRFLPFDIGMALTEAAKGTPGLSIRKLLTYCFDYDPESKSYMLRSFRLLALGILAALGIFFFLLVRKRPSQP